MPNLRLRLLACAAFLAAASIVGCGGTGSSTTPANSNSINVSIGPISSVSMVGGASQTFTAIATGDSANAGVTWTASAGAITSGGVYTAPLPVKTATATITATSRTDPTRSASAIIALQAISVAIAPATPATMIGGATQALTATVANDGANAGVAWTVSGGGSFSAGNTLSGVATIYAAPDPATAFTAVVTAASVSDPTKAVSLTISLTPISLSLTSASALALDGDGAQTATISASIAGDGTASGATFAVAGGGTISASTVGGNSPSATYTAPLVASARTSTITVASVKDPTKLQTVSVTLNPPMSFTAAPGALAPANIGTAYPGATVAVAGGTGSRTFSISAGSLPAGLAMSAAGIITGTPTGVAGTANFTVHVVDQASTPAAINGNFSIVVNGPALAWSSPGTGTDTYTVGTPIAPVSLSAAGGTGSVTYSVKSGTLPQGLQIVGNQVTGMPTEPTVTSGNVVTFLATDSSTPTAMTAASSAITFIANPVPLAITSEALAAGSAGVNYSYQLASTGGTGTINWSLTAGSLTGTGLMLSSSGQISGTPPSALSGLSLTFQAQDSAINQQQTKTVSLSLNVTGPLTITTTNTLPIAPPNNFYSQSLAAAGGTGSGYAWTVTSGASSLAALNLSVSSTGVISGTPTASGVASFTVQVKDSSSNTASASFTVTTYSPVALPSPNPGSLGVATITTPYTGSINATGGLSGYAWTVNGSPVPTTGASVALSNGLSVSNTGGASLNVTGTPSATGTVNFTASIADSTGATAGPFAYAVTVDPFYTVGGTVDSQVGCTTGGLNNVTVSINTNPVQTATTSVNGSFSFSSVPNGTYIITPSIAGSTSAFYPATETVVVNNNNLSAASFTATLGYSVSGTVAYAGASTGQIYLTLNPTGNCGGRSPGTSVSSTGAFTVRGVPPGTYTLQAFMDNGANGGNGVPNAANPTGSASGVNPTTANVSGVSVTLNDPAAATLSTAPTLTAVSPFSTGAVIQYKPILNGSGLEMASFYTLQWSVDSDFSNIDGSKRFYADGTHSNLWFLHGLTNGNALYFRVYGTSAGTSVGPYSNIIGPVTISAPVFPNAVSGSVSFAAAPTGPMYVGFYDESKSAFYGQYFPNPSSAQTYTIEVPTGSDYTFLALLDQNQDGTVDANDITNIANGSIQPILAISGNVANQNFTLPSADGIASVATQNTQQIVTNVVTQNYSVIFQVDGLAKLPVAASLISGPNLITPVDIAICGGPGSTCSQGFQIYFNLYGTSPQPGDSYVFSITYSDGTTGTLTAAISAVLNAFPTMLAPQTGTSSSTTPTFTWTDPVNAAAYSYQFAMTDSSNNSIWQIPAANATSTGFSDATTSIAWGVDPTGSGSTPTVSTLTAGTTYLWQITVQDSNGNSATTQVQYQP